MAVYIILLANFFLVSHRMVAFSELRFGLKPHVFSFAYDYGSVSKQFKTKILTLRSLRYLQSSQDAAQKSSSQIFSV